MSRLAFERACAVLGDLSPSELEQLGARIAALRTLSGPASSSPLGRAGPAALTDSGFDELLYRAVASELKDETGIEQPPWPLFQHRERQARAFLAAAKRAGEVHGQWFPKATRVETSKLVRIYATCALMHVRALGLPVGWSTTSQALAKLGEIVDVAFPGYARSGVLSLLLSTSSRMQIVRGPLPGVSAT